MSDQHLEKAREMARAIIESPEVCASVKERLIEGDLPPEVECLLWHLAFGGSMHTLPPRLRRREPPSATAQSPTFAVIRPSAWQAEVSRD